MQTTYAGFRSDSHKYFENALQPLFRGKSWAEDFDIAKVSNSNVEWYVNIADTHRDVSGISRRHFHNYIGGN